MGELGVLRLVLVLLLAASGAVVVGVARATADGRLGRNPWGGIRTRATLVSDETWLVAHRVARLPTEAGGWCLIGTAGVLAVVPSLTAVLVTTVVGTLVMLVLVLYGAYRGIRAVR